ncbi:hypothetical protein H2200_005548 [Cladophialophora chaetospira]|uniref:ABM domain-containing protein n=1 Tax=Cladophialophora chaetospira TaxID=386627 RepID=A0AA39CJY5_9EURO|nr:hypothetical protein H2200_005548 [Cladophialophora chaetospira]
MFEVVFEVQPRSSHWETYLATAGALRPILQSQRGFLDNVRYKSLTRPGWVLSLSDWENEKALIRWRTQSKHHQAQERGRAEILENYHLRVGEVEYEINSNEARPPQDMKPTRLDETETGTAKVVSLVKAKLKPLDSVDGKDTKDVNEVLRLLDFQPQLANGLVSWDAFEAILTPGDVLLLCSWADSTMTEQFAEHVATSAHQVRQVRIIRDYSMHDRAEAPQYYPEVKTTCTEKSLGA